MTKYAPTNPYRLDPNAPAYQGYLGGQFGDWYASQRPVSPVQSQMQGTARSMVDAGRLPTVDQTVQSSTLANRSAALDQELAKRRRRREMAQNLAVSGGIQAAQAAATLIPTAADRANRQELEALQRKQAGPGLGLDADERQLLERSQMDPVRSLASGARMQAEAQLAGMGQDSARAQMQVRRAENEAVSQAARQAGLAIAQANLDEKRREEMDMRSLTQAKADRQKEIFTGIASALTGVGGIAGQVMQARAAPAFDVEALKKKGMSDDQILSIIDDIGSAPKRKQADIASFYMGLSPSIGG